MVKIYCVKCRDKVEAMELVTGPIRWTSTAGKESCRDGWHGKCPNCSTRVKQFKKKEMAEAVQQPPAEQPVPAQEAPIMP